MTYIFGDVHFSVSEKWKEKVSNNIIKWFEKRFENENQENYAIFLGDVVDNYINPGSVVLLVHKLFDLCSKKFKHTYVLTGNHDVDYFHNHSRENFLSILKDDSFKNVTLIEEVGRYEIDGSSYIMMPHLLQRYNISLTQYYSNYDWEGMPFSDFALGHFVIKDEKVFSIMNKVGVDISAIPASQVICGHVHKRVLPNYPGSLYPCNPTEESEDRVFFKIQNGQVNEEKLPVFLEYKSITYPEKPEVETRGSLKVLVYTVSGVATEEIAKNFYKDIYIKGINIKEYLVSSDDVNVSSDSSLSLNDMINQYFNNHKIDPQIKKISEDILKEFR